MRIGVIGPIWQTIPPKGYGGSEVVVHNLVEGLVDLGHDVTLFAAGGSKTRATLVPVTAQPVLDIIKKFDFSESSYDYIAASEAFKRSGDFDILHNAVGYQLLPFTPFAACPLLHISHSSISEYKPLVDHFSSANIVSISDAQRNFHPHAHYIATVHHGIDTDRYVPGTRKEDFILFIGRIMPEKGVHLAIDAAKQCKRKIIIAGIVDDRDKDYFTKEVESKIDGTSVEFFGPADEDQKIDLMQRAYAHIFPTQWDEAFGLVTIEAMACGTPTIGWRKGAIPEVIDEGKTGFVVDTVDGMASAIRRVKDINPVHCREEAIKRFSRVAMAKGYEAVYKQIISS